MHIAFDGGAFQQTILGGIYNVACQFLNAYKDLQPDLRVTLVGDTRFGPMTEKALAGLTWAPDIMYAPVGPAYDAQPLPPAFLDPDVKFLVDNDIVAPTFINGSAIYRGEVPKKSFAILSRSQSPVTLGINADPRILGIAVKAIHLVAGKAHKLISIGDRGLSQGFYEAETNFRWTNGAAFIPIDMMSGYSGEIEIRIDYDSLNFYSLPEGPVADLVLRLKREVGAGVRHAALEKMSSELRAKGCDIYFANHFIPIMPPHQKVVAWAYDLIPILFPQFFHPDAQENFSYNIKLFRKAKRVFAISKNTADDLAQHADVPRGALVNASIAANPGINRKQSVEIEEALSRFHVKQGNYIICVSTLEPRKNHLRLLHAYNSAKNFNPDFPDLLFVGSMGWDYQPVLNYRANEKLDNDVKIFSDVADHDLACLYSGAKFSVYPSVYEGFGLPIIEAMACGVPVLTSNRSSMKEIAEGAAVLMDPYNVADIVRGLKLLNDDADLRRDMTEAGYARVKNYSWEKSARIIDNEIVKILSDSVEVKDVA